MENKVKRTDVNKIWHERVRIGEWVSTKWIYKSITDDRYFIKVDKEFKEIVFKDGIWILKKEV